MWPKILDWQTLKFGVEIEFVGADPLAVELIHGWVMSLDEQQLDESGAESGSQLKPPPLLWEDRDQIRVMLARLQAQEATANWSCGLHVHIGLEPWGESVLLPLVEAALLYQDVLQALLQTSSHRLIYCPSMSEEMLQSIVPVPGGILVTIENQVGEQFKHMLKPSEYGWELDSKSR